MNKYFIQVNLIGVVYYCGKRSFSNVEYLVMSYVLFLEYSVYNKGFVFLDFLYFGMFMDVVFDCGLGCYLGIKLDQEFFYFYNIEGVFIVDCCFIDLVGCKVFIFFWNFGQGIMGNDIIFIVWFKKML